MTLSSASTAEQLQLARTRQAMTLLLLGCAVLTWAPGHGGVATSWSLTELFAGRPLTLFVRYAALAAAFGAFQGAMRVRSRLETRNHQDTPENLLQRPEDTTSQSTELKPTVSRPLGNSSPPRLHVQVYPPAPARVAQKSLPSWTAFLPERWEAQNVTEGVLVKRDGFPPLCVLEQPSVIKSSEVTQVLWIADETVEDTGVVVDPAPYGWQVRGNALQLIQTLEAL